LSNKDICFDCNVAGINALLERESVQYLLLKEGPAIELAERRFNTGTMTLISSCSQHGGNTNSVLNPEFQRFLDKAIELYFQLKAAGEDVRVAVHGELHSGDEIPLYNAGRQYLLRNNIQEEDIIPEKQLRCYVSDGSYSGATEVYRAARYYLDHEEVKRLIMITDTRQALRKELHALECGVAVEIAAVSPVLLEPKFHSIQGVLFGILSTLLLPNTWQEGGELYEKTVNERRLT